MNLPAAFYTAGLWMIASAIWQLSYRSRKSDPKSSVFIQVGVDIIPGTILAIIVASLV